MPDDGWIKLHRKVMENPIFLNPNLLQIFIYCLLKANHRDNEMIWNNELITVKTGSFITGRFQMAKDLKQKESALYKRLQLLTKLGYIELKSNNKFTLLTIVKYKTYQISEPKEEQQSNNKVTTKEQQSNTNKNDKNEKNDKNINIPFDLFWQSYDKKRGDKIKLEKTWNNLTDTDRQNIMAYIPKYKIATPDKKFRKDPQTFFNNKSWNDEIIGIAETKPEKKLTLAEKDALFGEVA